MASGLRGQDSYSYQGQDLFVMEMLNGLRGGFFLDSGASNGLRGNNTWLLEQSLGWTGICVEPNAESFAQLVANRACICLNCCIYDREGSVEFLEAAGVLGGIATEYDAAHLRYTQRTLGDRWPDGAPPPTVQKVARTMTSILRGSAAPSAIDYWSLDTEGSELAILRSFPFDEYVFRVLTVEHNNAPVREEIREFLEARGYIRIRDLGIDDGYVLADEPKPRSWRSSALHRSRGVRR